jgi:hypothetical protein
VAAANDLHGSNQGVAGPAKCDKEEVISCPSGGRIMAEMWRREGLSKAVFFLFIRNALKVSGLLKSYR